MNANKLSDAMNFIDDDLLASCDEIRNQASSKAKTTTISKGKNKAKMTRLWGSIAAAAVVLIVGVTVVTLMNDSNKKSVSKHHHNNHNDSLTKSEEALETAAGVENFDISDTNSGYNDEEHVAIAPEYFGAVDGEIEVEENASDYRIIDDEEFAALIESYTTQGRMYNGLVEGEEVRCTFDYVNSYGATVTVKTATWSGNYVLVVPYGASTSSTYYAISEDEALLLESFGD